MGTQNFSLCHARDKTEKRLSLYHYYSPRQNQLGHFTRATSMKFFHPLPPSNVAGCKCFYAIQQTNIEKGAPISSFAKTNEADKIDDIRHEWLREHRARSDQRAIIKPCYDNMAWGKVQQGWGKANRTNASTCKIIFQDIRPAKGYSKIFNQSKASDKRERKHLAGTLGGSTQVAHQALRPLFFTTTRELMKLCFFL